MPTDLADLLTASGFAMAASNSRLAACGAPALLREFSLELNFSAGFQVSEQAATLLLTPAAPQNPQMQALMGQGGASAPVTLTATYIAAPSIRPAPGSEVCGP
jgi:hypothetical protein